jgi:prephenate dehydrogenase
MAADDVSPFLTIGIAGVGLVGGSLALAVRERWPSTRVLGVDRPAVLAHALGGGAIDRDLGPVDLLVLAAPVRQNLRLLGELAGASTGPTPGSFPRSMLVTDVGGTKGDTVRAARTLGLQDTFVGGHPLGGAERGGFGFARPDLFRGRPWIFTPDEGTPEGAVTRLEAFVRGLGARPVTMGADAHDRAMAFLSHLPQLTASALMDVVGLAVQANGLELAGRGLRDTTRLASSPAHVWRDISSTNTTAIGEALDALIAHLVELRADLPSGDALETIFDSAGRWRAELIKDQD